MVRARRAARLLLAVAVATSSMGFAAGDRKIGKWKLRVDSPAHGTREYEDRGDGVTVSIRQGVNARGQEYHTAYTAKVAGPGNSEVYDRIE
jgi:hypothetical protein